MSDTTEGTVLTQAESTKVRLAFAKMPFTAGVNLGILSPGSYRDGVTVDEIVTVLEQLGEVLRNHGADHDVLEHRYRELVSDVRAMRRVLGTESTGRPIG